MFATVLAFQPALPPDVRELIAQAERGEGPVVVWLRGTPPLPLSECLRMLNETRVPSKVLGWLIGMTLFGGDPRQQLAAALGRRSFRDDVIPHVLLAFSAGVTACGQVASPRLWTAIEMLVGRALPTESRRGTGTSGELAVGEVIRAEASHAICEALPVALASTHAVVRGCGLRLAQELGAPARAAIEAAIAAAGPAGPPAALAQAVVTLAGGEPPAADADEAALLDRLLDAWRATRDPALEQAIARVGAQLARVRGPVAARSFGELESAWLAIAGRRDPIDVTRLLELKFPAHWKRALGRVQALAGFSRDPRISIRLAEVARAYGSRSSRPLHVAIATLLAEAPTAAALPGIAAVVGHADVYQAARDAIAALAIRPADPALLARAGGEGPDVAALYDQLAANPGDLEARAVLADALQAVGDPRGELITLQLAIADGAASAGAARRVAALLHDHEDSWIGPLPGIERTGRRFERGFLVACETIADHAAIARTLDRPEWRTLEELSLRAPDVELAPLLARLPLLRRLCADDRALARLVDTARAPIPRLEVVFARGSWQPPPGMFPELRVLGSSVFADQWNVASYRTQLRLAVETGLHAVVYTAFPRNQLAAALSYASTRPPEVRFTLARHRAGFDPLGWRLRVRRDTPVIDVAWTYHRWADSAIAEVFEPLAAAQVARITLHMPDMLRAHLDRVVRERPLGIEVLPGNPIDLRATALT